MVIRRLINEDQAILVNRPSVDPTRPELRVLVMHPDSGGCNVVPTGQVSVERDAVGMLRQATDTPLPMDDGDDLAAVASEVAAIPQAHAAKADGHRAEARVKEDAVGVDAKGDKAASDSESDFEARLAKLGLPKHRVIGHIILGVLQEAGAEVSEEDLAFRYLEQIVDNVRTEFQLIECHGLVQRVIHRLTNEDRAILVRSSVDPLRR